MGAAAYLVVLGAILLMMPALRAKPTRLQRRLRAVSDAMRLPLRRIADVEAGAYVRIRGRIVDGGALVAPITGRTCVAFDALVNRRGYPEDVVARAVRGTPFVIDDGSGKVLVDPRGGYVEVVYDHTKDGWRGGRRDVADRAFYDHIPDHEPVDMNEGILAVGEHVTVAGLGVRPDEGSEGIYRSLAASGLHLVGAPDRAAVVSELPEDLES